MRNLILFFALLLIATNSHTAIITVKPDGSGHHTSIQAAYLAAASGDTVLVYPGIYYENLLINIAGKNIIIASLNLTTLDNSYLSNTIIDGNQSGSVIRIRDTELTEIVIWGFTIRNGSGHGFNRRGGGIYINESSPSIINCIIEKNEAVSGGGIYLLKSQCYLSGVTIRENRALRIGGGLFLTQDVIISYDTINKSNIYLNHAGRGADINKSYLSPPQTIILDTFTVVNPDPYFIRSNDNMGFPVNDLIVSITHGLIEPVNSDLYVDPVHGCNENSGLIPDEPLKTICFAYKKIMPDSANSNSVFLLKGVYSHSVNGESFPIQSRNYVNLIGESRENTILDAENKTYLYHGANENSNYSIKNITIQNGQIDTLASGLDYSGIFFNFNHNISIENLKIKDCAGTLGKLIILHSNNSKITNVEVNDSPGGFVQLAYSFSSDPTNFRIENLLMADNPPYYYKGEGAGGGLGISGRLSIPGLLKGSVTNLQITGHMNEPDPLWGPRMSVALILGNHAIVDIVNATIGHNIVRGEEGYAVGLHEGAIMNLYNTILYADSLYEIVLGESDFFSAPVTANICYSNIEGGPEQIYNWYNKHTLNWLEGNIDADPMWLGSGDYPYQLHKDSPCINAGTPMYVEGMAPPYIKMENDKIVLYKIDGDTLHLPPYDLAGNPRISGGRIDMGAYEYQDPTFIGKAPGAENDNLKLHIYPNPFWVHAFVTFRLQTAGKVLVSVSDINGRPVKTLMDSQLPPGEYNMIWKGNDNNGNAIPKGTYIISMYLNGQQTHSAKIVKR